MTDAGAWLVETDEDLIQLAGCMFNAEGERHVFITADGFSGSWRY